MQLEGQGAPLGRFLTAFVWPWGQISDLGHQVIACLACTQVAPLVLHFIKCTIFPRLFCKLTILLAEGGKVFSRTQPGSTMQCDVLAVAN